MATIAGRAAIFNIICWLLFAVPNFIDSVWSTFELAAIPLSAIIVGILNIVLIGLSLIGIYAMVNCCSWICEHTVPRKGQSCLYSRLIKACLIFR
jgi:hypothetical protein